MVLSFDSDYEYRLSNTYLEVCLGTLDFQNATFVYARFMINYRFDSMEAFIAKLCAANVDFVEGLHYHENSVYT